MKQKNVQFVPRVVLGQLATKGDFSLITEKCYIYDPRGHRRHGYMGFDPRGTKNMVFSMARHFSNGALVGLRWVANSRGLRTWLGKSNYGLETYCKYGDKGSHI